MEEKLNPYIFITNEGYADQPDSESIESDIENCQVIGFANGRTSKHDFDNLIKDNSYLLQTTFEEMVCYEMKKDYLKTSMSFTLPKTIP